MTTRPRILVVSEDDLCSGPLVAALLRREIERLGTDVEVRSAGVDATSGLAPCAVAAPFAPSQEAFERHRSTSLTADAIRRSDLVLSLDLAQRARVNRFAPGRQHTVFTLREAAALAVAAPHGHLDERLADLVEELHRRRGAVQPHRLAVPRRGLLRRPIVELDRDELPEAHVLDRRAHRWALEQAATAALQLASVLPARHAVAQDAA